MHSYTSIDRQVIPDIPSEYQTLIDLLRLRARERPGGRAYTFLMDEGTGEHNLTYSELDRQARSIGARLQSTVMPGDRVLLLYPPGLEYIAAFFGCLYAGAIAVPAYPPRHNRNLLRLQALVTDAQATVALTTSPVLSRIAPQLSQNSDLASLTWLASDQMAEGVGNEWQEPAVTDRSLALLQYTSGSTSAPKGVMVSHGNLLHNEQMIQRAFQQTAESVIVGWLPLYHDMGLIGNVIQPLFVGAPGILMSPTAFLQKPFRWLQAISHYSATTSGGPNFAYDLCVRKISDEQRAILDLSSWRVAFNGSEPIRSDTLERFTKAFAPCGFRRAAFHPCYGLAEATLLVSGRFRRAGLISSTVQATALESNRLVQATENENTRAKVGCGGSPTDQEIAIVDTATLTRCDPGQVGEVWVSGPSVAQGYWNQPEETQYSFHAHLSDSGEGPFLRTGDLGFLQDTELFITGRLKDLIIIRGLNHYPQDIELTVEKAHRAFRPGCGAAFSVEVAGEERLVIVQEVDRHQRIPAAALIDAINAALAEEHEVQAHAVVLIKTGTIPKTSSGKLQRYACRESFLAGTLMVVSERRAAGATPEELTDAPLSPAPQNAETLAAWLCTQIAAKLGIDRLQIDVNQPITRYGLDSLTAIELTHTIEANLNLVVPFTILLENFSIAQLAGRMLTQLWDGSVSPQRFVKTSAEDTTDQQLSQGEQALWFLHQVEPESAAYNIGGAVRVRSDLDTAALRRAFQMLVSRHPSLHMTFHSIDGKPVRRRREIALAFNTQDVSDWSEEAIGKHVTDEIHRPFDLEHGPLFRVGLLRRSVHDHILMLCVHHIVADFWSLELLVHELGALYAAEQNGGNALLPPIASEGADYVRWQNRMLESENGERHWNYWSQQLAGELAPLNLPTDRPRPPAQTYRGASQSFDLNSELTRKLKELGRRQGATLYMTLLAAFQTLLYRYTGQTDISVGSPSSNRSRTEFNGVVGYFVNSIVLRSDLSGQLTFEAFLENVRQTVLAAFTHQEYPFSLLVERLLGERDPSRSPLFQTAFNLQKAHLHDDGLALLALNNSGVQVNLGGLHLESVAVEQQVAKFDLTLSVTEARGSIEASLEYNIDLFDKATIVRMTGHLQTLLESIVDDPAQRLAEIPLLTNQEREHLLNGWNATVTEFPPAAALHQLVEEQVARTPEQPALIFEGQRLTYAELNRRANQLAHYLRKRDVGPEILVGVCMERSIEMVVALLGILKAGGAYVPLEPSYPRERLSFMLADAGVALVLIQERFREHISPAGIMLVEVETEWPEISKESTENVTSRVTPENLAYVIYTSGSTGKPKGAMNTHQGLCNRLLWMQAEYGLTKEDCVLQKTPFTFDVSVWEFFWPLITGARLVMAQPGGHQDGAYLVKTIQDSRITTLHFVPSMLRVFLEQKGIEQCQTLQHVISSGEELPFALQERFFERINARLHNLYGPTEASIDVTFWECRPGDARRVVPIGRPIANTRVYILDQELQPVPIGVPGELHLGGLGLGRGYLRRADLTSEKFIPDPFSAQKGARLYKTGDLARFLGEGEIEYIGRLDQQVKIRGFRIELGEIEVALAAHPAVSSSLVVPREYGPSDNRLVAYVVPDQQRAFPVRQLLRYKKDGLPDGSAIWKSPAGLQFIYQNKGETEFVYHEIFEEQSYLRNGITLDDDSCVFDVGANTGLFSIFVGQVCNNAVIYAFEPIPPVFDLLRLNTGLYDLNINLYQCGLSNESRTVKFTHYPRVSLISGRFADPAEERETVKAFILNQQDGETNEISGAELDTLLQEWLVTEEYSCQLRTVSDVIRENNVERIDLLKIDVEKSELDVLAGIEPADWPRIRQLVVEVHNVNGRLKQVTALLEDQGYDLTVEQDTLLKDTRLFNIYAVHHSAQARPLSHWHRGATPVQVWNSSSELVGDLRGFLKEKLPEYMVPSAFVFLDSLPLTSNGKIDQRALPAPESRPESEGALVSARNPTEEMLASIWAELLRVEKVGIYDNFFELGGDSILSIQIVARANQAGLRFTPRQIFQHQTIAQLAAVAGINQSAEVEQLTVSGAVPLTPVQHWFFDQNLPNPHHWNQSVLLEARHALNPSLLERALKQLLIHHDALRLRFMREELGWEQVNASIEESVPFSVNDLSAVSEPEQTDALAIAMAESQTSLNISTGPLLRAVYFDFGPDKPGNLLLVIHHLVVDGVSWRILLEDLQVAYAQADRGETVSLPPKTTSFRTWARGLTEYARSASAEQDVPYWLTVSPPQASHLLVDLHGGINTEASARTVTAALSVEETRALLHEVPAAYRTYINEVLLSALARSLLTLTREPFLLIDMEGHGREELLEGADVSRTVGWFTAIYPVLLKLEQHSGTAMLQAVKEQLRQIPHQGISYGASRYLHKDSEPAARLAELPQAEVSFNYLGQLDQLFVDSTLFANLWEIESQRRSPEGHRRYLLEINGSIIGGQLKLSWTYSEGLHHRATIERAAQNYLTAIREIIADCRSGKVCQLTPSDFSLANLTQPRLAQLLETYEELEDVYPLAPTQQGLLFHSLYAADPGIYVAQVSCVLRGQLNTPAFELAWQKVIERHTILRTAFAWENLAEPLQVVTREVALGLVTDDCRGLSVKEQEEGLASFLRSDRARGFDLQTSPLMRLKLHRVSDDAHQFVWSHHHLLLDGWSLPLVLNEVFTFYEAFSRGRDLHLDPGQPYLNYINWLRQQDPTESEAFWRKSLAGFYAPTPLILDRAQADPADPTSVYGEQRARLSLAATSALKAFARRHHLTLNTLLQGAWALLLNRYSGARDVVFGTAVSGRPVTMPGAQTMVGIFINTMPVRVQIPFDGSLSSWLQKLQDKQSELQKHEHIALVQIQEWSEVPYGMPLFESVLILLNYPLTTALQKDNRSLGIEDLSWFEQTNYPLTMQVTPGRELLLKVAYDHGRFDAPTIERILGHFQVVLEAIGTESETSLADVSVLTEAERQQVLLKWNDTQRDYTAHQCLHELFEEQALRTPDAIAVSYENELVSYADLNRRANKLAHHLRKLGVSAEVLVGICVERSIEMVVGVLGILKAGAAYVPLDPSYPLERLSFMLEDAALGVLLTEEKLADTLPSHWGHTICLDTDWATIDAEDTQNLFGVVTEENLAYVIYTSGSTGRPKGAMLNHRGIVNCVRWMQDTYKLDESDRFLLKTSLNFDPSVWELFWTWATGGRVVVARPEGHLDSAYLVDTITREQITSVYFVPPMLRVFLEEARVENATSLRRVICGGEGLPKETLELFLQRLSGVELHHSYGPTEASIAATEWRCEAGVSRGMAPIGRPLANTEVYLLDEHLKPVPVGVGGELYIGGVGVGRGYLNQPQLTGERFMPHPFSEEAGARLYRTGDVGRYLSDGTIEFVGRRDSQVKLRGYRIELGEIEAVLCEHPGIQSAVVVVTEEAGGDKQLAAYVVADEAASEMVAEFRSYLRARVPEHMVPTWMILLDEMPLTSNGKVDRHALPAPQTNAAAKQPAVVSPRTAVEEMLAGIWTEVLGVEELSVTANFFELGGHSLLATQVMLRVREAFGIDVQLRSLFESPTVRGLAEAVEQELRERHDLAASPLKPLGRAGELPLSYAQQRLWFLDQLEPENAFYNCAVAMRLTGQLNVVALEHTLSEIIRRHEVLRTSFPAVEGKPVQVIAPANGFNLPVRDLSQISVAEREVEVIGLAREEADRPFDLSCGLPLLRASLLKLEAEEHVVLFTVHHIVSDGWSVGILLREVALLYEAYSQGQSSPLPELAIQYADFAMWQREWLTGQVLDKQLSYWKRQLQGVTKVLELPTDRVRPEVQTFRGTYHTFSLTPELSRKLKELSRNEDVTLFMTLLAAWQTLLYHYTNQEQISVGTLIANRNRAETEMLIGFFVNTLVMNSDLSGNPSFRELLRRVREVCLGAYAHQDVPFEKLVEVLQPERSLSNTPLVQVWLALQNAPESKPELAGLSVSQLTIEGSTAKFDLGLNIADAESGLVGTLQYKTDLFNAITISRIARQFETLLDSIVAEPQSRLNVLVEILADEQRKRRSTKAQEFKAADRQTLKSIKRKTISV
jgi:amino acid adenylation domain-containing protein/non-ribosomal peptide synthase protein (TIGR01720 family)/FkbM family methyltransferase